MLARIRLALPALCIAVAVLFSAPPAQAAASFAQVQAAIDAQDWAVAETLASQLDGVVQRGDFFAAYVGASSLVRDGNCAEAVPLLEALQQSQPQFLPAYELSFVCYQMMGQRGPALRQLDSIMAILPAGPQRTVIEQIKSNIDGEDGIVINVYADVAPSSNVDRQTAHSAFSGLTIDDNSRGHAGAAATAGVSFSKTLLTSERFALAGVLRFDLGYSTADQLLDPSVSIELPMTFAGAYGQRVLITPYASTGWAGEQHSFSAIGVRANTSFQVTSTVNLGFGGAVAAVQDHLRPYLDGLKIDSSASVSWLLDPSNLVTTRAMANYSHTDDDRFRAVDVSALARLDHSMQSGLLLGAEARVGTRLHASPPPLSVDGNQTDHFIAARGEVSHRDFAIGNFIPTLYYEYRQQWSDNVFYEYHSHDIGIYLRAKF